MRGFRNAGLWQHRRKDGTNLDVEVTSHDHRFDGRPARVVAALDVTDRVRAERALRRSEARYRDLFENASDLIASTDLDGRLTAVNETFVQATGYSRDELIGTRLDDLAPEEQRDLLRGAREDKLGRLETTMFQLELLARDGRRIPIEVASRLIVEDGRPIGTEATCRDLSERLRLEEELRQAQRLEAVGRLAGGVAHDFNNILTVIGGYTDAVLARNEGSEEELRQIAAATTRASSLTRQLLAFSRQQVLQPRALLVNDVIEGLMPMLSRLIGEDVELVTSLAPDVAPVLADAGQLEQILVNLAVNARDAISEGGRLTIQTSNVELDEAYLAHHGDATAGPHVLVSVADDGAGMDAETLAHAFEPFYTTKDVGYGTGLGLATVYGIVKQSGGSVWAYSEAGQGTTIKIYLPTTDAPVEARDELPAPAVVGGAETILLAEDEASLRRLIARMLTQHGYDVIAAETASDALRIAEREPDRIELLLTDLVMPEMSGRALAERIGRVAPGTPVLFMSGYSDEAVTRNGSLEPGAAFMEKPFTGDELAAKVRQMLGSRTSEHGEPSEEEFVHASRSTKAEK
jgi:PAS domain S-box-containing protein